MDIRIRSLIMIGIVSLSYVTEEPFKFTSHRSDDRIDVKSDASNAVFIVRSPTGISHLIIERTAEHWPDKVLIQLRLKGLESIKLMTEELRLQGSVSSHDGSVRVWKEDKEDVPLDSDSPYWMEIKMLDDDGKPTEAIPLQEGYFEMQLPGKFFENNPTSFKVEWIDFYRS